MQLLGAALVHAQRIEDLDKSRFAMGSLFGKYLIVDDDVRAGARLPDGVLKTISEAKEVTGELKYKQPFNFAVRAVPVFAVQQHSLPGRPVARNAAPVDGHSV
jgi:putative DNA primase/helicase